MTIPLRRLVRLVTQCPDRGPRPFVALENLASGTGRLIDADGLVERDAPEAGAAAVEPGTVLFGKLRPYLAKSWLVDRPVYTSTELLALEPAGDVESRWLGYVCLSRPFVDWSVATSDGAKMPRTSWPKLGEFRLDVPPISAQREIADFLDGETARIDALIEKKQRMVALLDERQRAVIDGLTVPRALGGNADARNRTPWPVTALKRIAAFFSDGDWIESPFITSEGIRLIQTGNVGEGEYREQGFRFISEETFEALQCTEVFSGDILISRLAGPVGCACLAPDLGVRMIAAVDVAIIRPTDQVVPDFVVAYLSSARHLALAELLARGTTMQRLSRSQVGDMPLPLPDLAVQRAVATKVAASTELLKKTKHRLGHQIALLRERRQALITAAVTGQLDVAKAAA